MSSGWFKCPAKQGRVIRVSFEKSAQASQAGSSGWFKCPSKDRQGHQGESGVIRVIFEKGAKASQAGSSGWFWGHQGDFEKTISQPAGQGHQGEKDWGQHWPSRRYIKIRESVCVCPNTLTLSFLNGFRVYAYVRTPYAMAVLEKNIRAWLEEK